MSALVCGQCGTVSPAGSHFCRACGRSLADPASPWTMRSRYLPLRFQIDPMDPMPRRDLRWIMITTGSALLVVAILLFAVGAIVGAATSVGCGPTACAGVSPGPWFEWAGVPLLVTGLALLGAGLWLAFR